jgi:hypothetical protein
VVYDTPGVTPPSVEESRSRSEEITTVHSAGYVNAVVIVLNSSQSLDLSQSEMLEEYVGMFGAAVWDHVCFVFTDLDSDRRHEVLQENPNALREYAANALRRMGGETGNARFWTIDPSAPEEDRHSAGSRNELLQSN